MSNTKKELRRKGSELGPTVHIGKAGVTEGTIEELGKQIRERKLVKVKFLPSSDTPKEEMAKELAERSSSTLVEIRGNTALLCDKRIFG